MSVVEVKGHSRSTSEEKSPTCDFPGSEGLLITIRIFSSFSKKTYFHLGRGSLEGSLLYGSAFHDLNGLWTFNCNACLFGVKIIKMVKKKK